MNLPALTTGTGAIVTIVKRGDGRYHLMPNHKPLEAETDTQNQKDKKMDKNIQHLHSYWVNYRPKDACHDSGIMCRARVKATDGIGALAVGAGLFGLAGLAHNQQIIPHDAFTA